MKFEARSIDMNLELSCGEETKIFAPRERPSASFAGRVSTETSIYVKAQKSLPVTEQDSVTDGYLKALSFIYKDFDISWTMERFTNEEIKSIYEWAGEQLNGVKKGQQS